jgi:PKD repeat protein
MKTNNLSIVLITVLFLCRASAIFAQSNWQDFFDEGDGERYFRFSVNKSEEIYDLSTIISIDKIEGNNVVAWANRKSFSAFLKCGYEFEFLPLDTGFDPVMHDFYEIEQLMQWNSYPTYEAFETMMYQFESDHSSMCSIHNIGTLASGRKLLGAQINASDEPKPQFLYSATMHGDELTGYVLSLRLIDYLLTQYGTDPFVTRLVDSVEIWIVPLANPDGTYYGGNHTVMNSRRGNANNIDLNRNYPDPKAGPHPDGNSWQPETIAFMDLAEENKFTMGANMHGGAEVCNYPWDTWSRFTADDAWWIDVCREYADTAQFYSPPGYLTQHNNGITNGYAWYSITGGRQDYMNYFHGCREFTLEISNVKKLPESQLDAHWNYNYRSFLNYIEQSLYGVRGIVADAYTQEALEAKVYISGHDIDSSHVYSRLPDGNYHRHLFTGTYDITFSSPCHYPVTIQNVSVQNRQTTWLNVELEPLPAQANFSASVTTASPEQEITFTDLSCGAIQDWAWLFPGGIPGVSSEQNPTVTYLFAGDYDVQLIVSDGSIADTLRIENYITIAPNYLMSNQSVSSCLALFYDSGGPNRDYNSNENFSFTFLPSIPDAMITTDFTFFEVEHSFNCNSDYLKIYDGISASSDLIGTYCGTNSPGMVSAGNADGALTFVFKSDGSVTKPGWEAVVRCIEPEAAPVAGFVANVTQVNTADTVYFFDQSSGDPTTWEWVFEGGIPETSSEKYPMVIYPAVGTVTVELTVINEFGSDQLIMDDYITVDSGVGMAGIRDDFSLLIFPNPLKDGILHIRSAETIQNFKVYNLLGQELLTIDGNSRSIQLDALHQGIYLIKVQSSRGVAIRKVQIL